MERFDLMLVTGKVVSWTGTDGVDAARRYVDCHRDASVTAWRHPRIAVVVGVQTDD